MDILNTLYVLDILNSNNENLKLFLIVGIIFLSLILIVCFLTRKYSYQDGDNSSLREKSKEEKMYDKFLKKIKKAFLNILVASSDIPDLTSKTIIKCDNIDDLVDISEVKRKPIYYIENSNEKDSNHEKSCDFLLIHDNEACVYTLKPSNDYLSPLEKYIEKLEEGKIKGENQKLLQDIDKTMIIEIPDGSLYKVSPLKKGKGKNKKITTDKVDSIDLPKLK